MSEESAAREPIISVSGLRGIVGETLTPDVARRYVTAFAALAPPGPMVVANDGRPSGRMLAEAIHAAFHALKRNSVDAGIAATPTTGVLVRHLGAAGGVQITASHNPAEYNGLKLFSDRGRVIPKGPGQEVLTRYRSGEMDGAGHDLPGAAAERCADPISPHLKAVLGTVDVERIRGRRFNVVLDSNHGAGSLLGTRLLEELGCRVTLLGGRPDGQYEHPPEPLAENLATVCPAVVDAGADVGFCQDPDADRLAVIDASGRYLGEEYTLTMCVDHVLRRTKGPIVANCSTSRVSKDLAEKYG
ncbi:MAG: phosphoglucosamine mutase, partial [Planctomycetes bacterium]|nr:phosphoglucosamine mutase [Planctomycetota bacterium]